MSDNIINFEKILKTKDPVKKVCDIASKEFRDVLLIGEDKNGELRMITTLENYADMMYMMEIIKMGIITKGAEGHEEE
jgi:hypothetical protein|tara:strand:+ start:118 stop:351 length:234 start_codon:yes stop_codon:yes gene_type:complete